MATSILVPLSVYLETSYRPDRDWIDGELRERNLGEGPHGVVQKFLAMFLGLREEAWGILVIIEQRVQVSETRFRIPDVCVLSASEPFEAIVRHAPMLCVEILSKDDSMTDILERAEDYRRMGVPCVWIIDPRRRTALQLDEVGSSHTAEAELTVPGTEIRLLLAALFAQLNKLEGRA